ncbi:MAG: hypothetical protein LBU45_01445 [Azoarcus sp.]|nr:hypothetical protein [Azoarcus sp.]
MIVLKLLLFVLILLFLLGFGILGIVLRVSLGVWSRLLGVGRGRGGGADGEARASQRGAVETERMLACAVCGVHVPESEGVSAAGEFFCCDAHRQRRRRGKAGGQ